MATAADPVLSRVAIEPVVLFDVAWETYCRLRDPESNNSIRMTYLDGTLTLMSPALRHDNGSRLLLLVVATVAEASGIEFEPTGTTTLRVEGVGKEPDEGFYLGDAAVQIRDNEEINLRVDPPPTLAIEVDHTGDSSLALTTYARIGVPEVWVFKPSGPSLWFGRLVGFGYEPIGRSVVLPRLTSSLVLEALAARTQGKTGTLAWMTWLREWASALPEV